MSDSLRVVMVTTSYPRREGDFAGHFVAGLASAIVDLGHVVEVIAPHEPGVPAVEELFGVPVCRMRYGLERFERLAYGDGIVPNIRKNPLVALAAPALASALRRGVAQYARDADIVHAHWAPTAALSRAGDTGIPMVVSLHGSDLTLAHRGGPWLSLLRHGLAGAQAVNVMACSQREELLRSGLYDGHIEVIPSGVMPSLASCERTERLDDEFRILFVGRVVPGKGVGDLLSAFRRVANEVPEAQLTIAGAGPSLRSLESRANSYGLGNRVRFLGEVPHDEALRLMCESDVLALASYGEGSPLSVTEALTVGTPVVGTTIGAMPELVGNEGILVEPGDLAGIARALLTLARDVDRREAMGAAARIRMARDYGWPSVAVRTVDLYRHAIDQVRVAR